MITQKGESIIRFLKNLIAPKKCYSCGKEGHFLCGDCTGKLQKFESLCFVCKEVSYNYDVCDACEEDIYYDKCIIFSHYRQKLVKKLIKDLKFYKRQDIAEEFGPVLSEALFDHENFLDISSYLIIPAPMYFFRRWQRGYNHTELLSYEISKCTDIPVCKGVKKLKNTLQQSKKSRKERLKNLEGSFKINNKYKELLKGKSVILVDDVVSTGTTVNEISKALKKAGVKKVIVLVIASG